MQISKSWLNEWVTVKLDTESLSEKLTLAGLEVEAVEPAGPGLDDKVVVAQITSVEPHPDADRLKVCKVDIGRGSKRTVVCGAPNARDGMISVLALPGAKLPELKVKTTEIRGVRSQGMLCSSLELGLDDQSQGIMELDAGAEIGQQIVTYLNLTDSVFHLELTPNRGDCLGTRGVAREVATLTGNKFKDRTETKIKPVTKDLFTVRLDAPKGCPRYVGRAVCGIDIHAKTPDWMVEKLRRCGMRSINIAVDVTNYVMHDLGQPMHAFDMDKINGGIRVRWAKSGERLKLLDGSTVRLVKDNLLIADHKRGIALAGIMGGDNTAVSGKTKSIYLEAAYFSQDAIQGKARELGMHTDASHRFERGVDSELQLRAMERATELLVEIAGGSPGPITHAANKTHLPKKRVVQFDTREVKRILGQSVPVNSCIAILKNLGMKVAKNKNGLRVTVPSWRFDISGSHDLVEEIGRCYGFDKFSPRLPSTQARVGFNRENFISESTIKNTLVDLGYHEAITYSFVDPAAQKQILQKSKAIKLQNPIADNLSVMRQSLWPGLIESMITNINRQESRVRLFEIGHVFFADKNSRKSKEIQRLGMLICGPRESLQWGKAQDQSDFFDLKGDLESLFTVTGKSKKFTFERASHSSLHPGQSAKIKFANAEAGYIGALHPDHQKFFDLDQPVFLAELDMSILENASIPEFTQISRYPLVQRDLSIVVGEEVDVGAVLDSVRRAGSALLKKLELFDIYTGKNIEKNTKSLAFSLTFQSESSNLKSSEVEAETDKIVRVLGEEFGAQLRV